MQQLPVFSSEPMPNRTPCQRHDAAGVCELPHASVGHEQAPQPVRLVSVDALRGLTVGAMLLVNNPGDWEHIYAVLKHAPWHGATPTDLVFPFFLFLVGVSIALGPVRQLQCGHHRTMLVHSMLWRMVRIVSLGLLLHTCFFLIIEPPYFRPFGVLQRIGLCFIVAGAMAVYTTSRTQWIFIVYVLLGYWGATVWGGSSSVTDNLESRLDTILLGPYAYIFDPLTGAAFDPEGLLSSLPAIASTMIGVRVGVWLQEKRISLLLVGAITSIIIGELWSIYHPFNKNLWTSSYVVWSAGWAGLVLAFFYELMDKRSFPALGRCLGVNAIAVYAGSSIMAIIMAKMQWGLMLYTQFFGWLLAWLGPYAASASYAVCFFGWWWLIAFVLDQYRIYFKI